MQWNEEDDNNSLNRIEETILSFTSSRIDCTR